MLWVLGLLVSGSGRWVHNGPEGLKYEVVS